MTNRKSRKRAAIAVSPYKENRNRPQRQVNRKAFAKELSRQLKLHGDTNKSKLTREVKPEGGRSLIANLNGWLAEKRAPRLRNAYDFLNKLETRYHLPKDYFRDIAYPPTPTKKKFSPHFLRRNTTSSDGTYRRTLTVKTHVKNGT